MGIHKGTKLTETPKDVTFKVRLDQATNDMLSYVAEKENLTKSEVIRRGIEMQFSKTKK